MISWKFEKTSICHFVFYEVCERLTAIFIIIQPLIHLGHKTCKAFTAYSLSPSSSPSTLRPLYHFSIFTNFVKLQSSSFLMVFSVMRLPSAVVVACLDLPPSSIMDHPERGIVMKSWRKKCLYQNGGLYEKFLILKI